MRTILLSGIALLSACTPHSADRVSPDYAEQSNTPLTYRRHGSPTQQDANWNRQHLAESVRRYNETREEDEQIGCDYVPRLGTRMTRLSCWLINSGESLDEEALRAVLLGQAITDPIY
ncbi:MAG: hypothetical protein AAF465_03510 [Pseudomonadota bacterium]